MILRRHEPNYSYSLNFELHHSLFHHHHFIPPPHSILEFLSGAKIVNLCYSKTVFSHVIPFWVLNIPYYLTQLVILLYYLDSRSIRPQMWPETVEKSFPSKEELRDFYLRNFTFFLLICPQSQINDPNREFSKFFQHL
jgi:hypothetical protein